MNWGPSFGDKSQLSSMTRMGSNISSLLWGQSEEAPCAQDRAQGGTMGYKVQSHPWDKVRMSPVPRTGF